MAFFVGKRLWVCQLIAEQRDSCPRAQSNTIAIDPSVARLCPFPSLDLSDGDAGNLFPLRSGMEGHGENRCPRLGNFL